MIAKKIHYIWFGGEKPEKVKKCIESWYKYLPDYEIIEWNEKNIDIEEEKKKNKFFKVCYEKKIWALLTDYLRTKILYENGGIYLDTDVEIVKSFDNLLNNDFFMGFQAEDEICYAVIGSIPKHAFLKDMKEFYEVDIWKSGTFLTTHIIGEIVKKKYYSDELLKKNNMKFYSEEYFYPYYWTDEYTDDCIEKNTYAIHHWDGSWTKNPNISYLNLYLKYEHLNPIKKFFKIRKKLKELKNKNSVRRKIKELKRRKENYRNLDEKYREIPVEPWAFIRVKNEIKTIKACLESVAPVIKKGVIGYHKLAENEYDDGTEEYIIKFCKKNPGYIPYRYENEVIPACDDRYKKLPKIPRKNRLDSYYNSVLEQIPKGEWIIKIDCDHVYDTEKLRKLMYLPKEDNDIISFTRFNLHYEDEKLYVIKKDSFYDVCDHWLLKNNDLYFKFSSGIENNMFYAWEQLVIPEERKIYNTDLFNWHFPFIKSSREISKENLIEFHNYKISLYDKLYYHIKKDMVNEERIMAICSNFK